MKPLLNQARSETGFQDPLREPLFGRSWRALRLSGLTRPPPAPV